MAKTTKQTTGFAPIVLSPDAVALLDLQSELEMILQRTPETTPWGDVTKQMTPDTLAMIGRLQTGRPARYVAEELLEDISYLVRETKLPKRSRAKASGSSKPKAQRPTTSKAAKKKAAKKRNRKPKASTPSAAELVSQASEFLEANAVATQAKASAGKRSSKKKAAKAGKASGKKPGRPRGSGAGKPRRDLQAELLAYLANGNSVQVKSVATLLNTGTKGASALVNKLVQLGQAKLVGGASAADRDAVLMRG